jgi:hypothetical protein
MITKAIIQSINAPANRCIVRMPLFETAANPNPVEAEALVNITPGIYNNLEVGDVVFVAFEENALEKPIIIGKLFRGTEIEGAIRGGGAIIDSLKVRTSAAIPASSLYVFPEAIQNNYKDLNTPKKQADYIKWLEAFTKKLVTQLEDHFKCFKNWVQWQLRPENIEIDDGDLDSENYKDSVPLQYQTEGEECKLCGANCTKKKKRSYSPLPVDKKYPEQ